MAEQDLFQRILKRRKISEGLASGESLHQVKTDVRGFENTTLLPLADRLQTEEFAITPEIDKIATELSQVLREKFPEISNLSVVILGSAVHGGGVVRQAMGIAPVSDFDWAITYDKLSNLNESEENQLMKQVRYKAEEVLPNLALTYLGYQITSCPTFNPNPDPQPRVRFTLPSKVENFHSTDDAVTFIKDVSNRPREGERILFLLQPSYPAEVNQQNLEFLIAGIKKLVTQDVNTAYIAIDLIGVWWKQYHLIKEKHLLEGQIDHRTKNLTSDFEHSQMVNPFLSTLTIDRLRQAFDEALAAAPTPPIPK